jgi:hypothetical protein
MQPRAADCSGSSRLRGSIGRVGGGEVQDGWETWRCGGWRAVGQAEVAQDSASHGEVGDGGDDVAAAATLAEQHVDLEGSLHELGPAVAALA